MAGPHPIPCSEVIAWLNLNELHNIELRREFYVLVMAMDQTWLEWSFEKISKKTKSAGASKKSKQITKDG